MTRHDTAAVASLPACDLCTAQGRWSQAAYDGKTYDGPWAFMCHAHFRAYGIGLGEGRGQRLVVGGR